MSGALTKEDLKSVSGAGTRKQSMNDLLTLSDIAEMNHCSVRHARDVIVKLPGFPAEAPTSTPRNRLWLRAEVRAFVHRKPAQIPHMRLKAA